MNALLRLAGAMIVATPLLGCGSSLDLGSDTRPGCEGTPSTPQILTNLAEAPDFYPSAMVIVDDDAYVGGIALPPEGFTSETFGIGRLYRVPLRGGAAVEVWRGDSFRAPMKVQGARIVFAELDVTSRLAKPVYGGLDAYDTTTGLTTRIPNLPGREFVLDFAVGEEGVVFSAGSFTSADDPKRGYSIARHADGRTESIFEHRERSATFFLRDGHVLAQLPADGTETGYDDEGKGDRFAAFSVSAKGIALERRFDELPGVGAFAGQVVSTVVQADANAYYVGTRTGQQVMTQRFGRTRGNAVGETVVSSSLGYPTFLGAEAYFIPSVDRSMIRTRVATSLASAGDTEVVFDPRRQVGAFALDACRIAWVSESSTEVEKKRIMLAPRP